MEMLRKCKANHTQLTPVSFLKRAAGAYATRASIVYEGTRFTWLETYHRCRRLAFALRSLLGIKKNEVVSVLAPNVPALYEMHFAVPMAGAVLNPINIRLDANNIAVILQHSEAKVFFVDYEFVPLAKDALRGLVALNPAAAFPLVVVIDDIDKPKGIRFGELEYEKLLFSTNNEAEYEAKNISDNNMVVADEWDPIALNYTSGTTSAPKGVVYSHRGAYLSTLSLILGWEMGHAPVYLWTLPMFHCNGWTFTWGVAARGGTNVCLRSTAAADVYRNIALHGVTHMCCAPVVFNILLEGGERDHQLLIHGATRPVQILTGGSPPPPAMLERVESLGFRVTHAYGMTEATGPALVCEWQGQWDRLPAGERARLKARQGVSVVGLEVDVKDPATMASAERDGRAMGEIALRGSSVMKGYFKDPAATAAAFRESEGWFMTGDVGVVHPDGYVEIKDRSKDVIISGGENISSVEVEAVLYRHPKVKEAAVVAMPHPRWGESPCAFVRCGGGGGGAGATEGEIVAHCRERLPGFMVPKKVVFVEELPKTSTGKIQKFELRAAAKTLVSSEGKTTSSGRRAVRQVGNENQRGGGYIPEPQEQMLAQSRL